MTGTGLKQVGQDKASFGGVNARIASMVAVGVVAAVAGASAAVGAARIDQIDRSTDADELIAGVALFASAILVAVVALARTRLAMQETELARLRERVLDAELRSEMGMGDEEWEDKVFETRDREADRFVLRCSER